MESWLGSSLGQFIGITLLMAGFCAYMTGQAIANTWRPLWQLFVYGALLAAAARFLTYALFDGPLLSIEAFAVACVVCWTIALVAFRLTRARKMVVQYPWLYERVGLFGWRSRH